MNGRNTTIDVAKGIGIILVVAGHNWSVLHPKGEVFRIIFSFQRSEERRVGKEC